MMTDNNRHIIPDIEGLRAVAVVAVLLYHAHLGVPGGFVGVDVFFVISGYLITALLARELASTGRVSMSGFYARRARRLLPAASVVLVATLIMVVAFGDPVRRATTATDALWSGAFAANFHFAAAGADYFASAARPSILQHWWSLAVEEQFYLVWPVMMGFAWRIWPNRVRLGPVALAAAVVGVSLPLGAAMTISSPSWAYFATCARGWELAAGALVALAWPGTSSALMRAAMRWGGLGAIGAAAFGFTSSTAFPGWAALLPVGGAVAVLMSVNASVPSRILGMAPMQWLGARSYGLYLWHWPLLVLLDDRVDSPSPLVRGSVLVAAVVLSGLMYVVLENPIRFAPALVASRARSLGVGAAFTVLVVASGLVVRAADSSLSTGYTAETLAVNEASSATTVARVPPEEQLRRRIATELHPLIESSARTRLVPNNLRPALQVAANDKVAIFGNHCMAGFSRLANPPCIYGDARSDTVLALFGDSHAAQWFPALEAIAKRNGYGLHALTKMGCPAVSVSVRRDLRRDYPECDTWRRDTLARIVSSKVDLVVLSSYRYRRAGVPKGVITEAEWEAGLRKTLSILRAAGKKVMVLSDTPVPGITIPECVAKNVRRIDQCMRPKASTVLAARRRTEQRAAAAEGASYWDTTEWVCTDVCPPVVGNLLVYLDNNHLTNTFATYLSPYLELAIKSEL